MSPRPLNTPHHRWIEAKRRQTKLGRLTHENQAREFFERRVTKARLRNLANEASSVAKEAASAREGAAMREADISDRVLGGYLVHRAAPELIKAEYDRINVPTFREKLRMDLVARQLRGGPPADLEKEMWNAAGRRIFGQMARELGVPVYVPPAARDTARSRTPAERPHSSSSREQAVWWGIDVDRPAHRPVKGDTARPARDTEATRVARDAATAQRRLRGRGAER